MTRKATDLTWADTSTPSAGAAYVFGRAGAVWSHRAYLKASNTRASASFGFSVAVSPETLAVGAYRGNSGATRINGDQGDTTASEAGAVYLRGIARPR